MIGGPALGVLRGQTGAVVERVGGAPVGHGVGERVLHLLAVSVGAPVEAEHAAVDLGHAQPGGLELAQAEGGVVVDLLGEGGRGGTDAGHQLAPHVHDRVLALGHVDVHVGADRVRRPAAGTRGTSRAS